MNYIKVIENIKYQRDETVRNRRIIKLMEELGEVSEAFLNVTSPNNRKNKSWNDVREELVDSFIVAIDIHVLKTKVLSLDNHVDLIQVISSYDEKDFESSFIQINSFINRLVTNTCSDKTMNDLINVLANLALIRFPDIDAETDEQIKQRFDDMFISKINKWLSTINK